MGLEPVAAGDAHEHEAAPVALVLLGQLVAQRLDLGHRELDELREHRGSTGSVAAMHDRLDRAARFASITRRPRSRRRLAGIASTGTSRRDVVVALEVGGSSAVVVPVVEARRRARLALGEAAHEQLAERSDLREVDDALLEQLEHREEAHDDLEPVVDAGDQVAEAHRPGVGQQRAARVSTASRTLARIGAMWSVSTITVGPAARAPRRAAARSASGVTRSSGSGASERNGSSGPAVRGTLRRPRRDAGLEHRGRVLERLALEQAGEEQVALLEAQQLLVELGSCRARAAGGGP